MDDLPGSAFQNPNPLTMKKKRRSTTTRRPRQGPDPDDTTAPGPAVAKKKKRDFFLNAPPPAPAALATYRRAASTSTSHRPDHSTNNKVKLKLRVAGVSHTIHHPKDQDSHVADPARKSIRMNNRRLLHQHETPLSHSAKPTTKKRLFKTKTTLPSDDSTDYEPPEEEHPAPIAHVGPNLGADKVKTLTSRQRAMLKGGKDSARVEFPEGLPPAPSRKLKNKVTDEEQQAKKAEAAQRRRLQVEKAARESQEDAIRKILGLDSDKKKEEKRQKEKEQKERRAESLKCNGSSVKWVMGPSGTVVSFPDDVGLPYIFNSKPCRYPPPREKCAGPACNNTYRYRDSKSKLPLCSLECYRAVQETA